MVKVTYDQVVAYRLHVNHLVDRLPPGEYERAVHAGLQDTGPRDALVSLHARVTDCPPDSWEDERLVQAYSPRQAVYLLPKRNLGVFTIGRLPSDPQARKEFDELTDRVCRELAGHERRGSGPVDMRQATWTGRVVIRWTASAIFTREVPAQDIDPSEARRELCRRHVHAFGPTTTAAYAWWTGLPPADAQRTWEELADELTQVDVDGTTAWILTTDKDTLTAAPEPKGIRLIPAPELRLFGQDKTGLFVGPGERRKPPGRDSFHAHGVVVDGELAGAWGRSKGKVRVRLARALTAEQLARLEHEVLTMPIPNATMSLVLERDEMPA
ncbi:DNA glycosylase AlkZ-like family protein [Tenggerimyces flavus]|uniref:DNA glycosylase AlkZ-like family protein n=1 Tax=Tenggerimyces flavus TaxID=1708749 RepID=A0ABV7YH62_9ACTN|nr:crosslink repair DNA glycosylase YcaQ family protein [Tenggerimyces flavus]MBM7788124.1 hypothetical protein [Tenggerimyces flavus]